MASEGALCCSGPVHNADQQKHIRIKLIKLSELIATLKNTNYSKHIDKYFDSNQSLLESVSDYLPEFTKAAIINSFASQFFDLKTKSIGVVKELMTLIQAPYMISNTFLLINTIA
ncbi:MAG: hypothetical protein MHPSP_003558, partial [Paramarteilia canceri]